MANTGCTLRLSVRHTEGLGALLAGVLLLASGVAAQNGPLRKAGPTGSSAEKIDLEAVKQLRDAAMNPSQIMEMVGELSDVRGPRLTCAARPTRSHYSSPDNPPPCRSPPPTPPLSGPL